MLSKLYEENNSKDYAQQIVNKLKTYDNADAQIKATIFQGYFDQGDLTNEQYEEIQNYFNTIQNTHKDSTKKIKQATSDS